MPLKVGNSLKHPQYGEGKIVEITDNAADRIICVKFENIGIKRISEKWMISKMNM